MCGQVKVETCCWVFKDKSVFTYTTASKMNQITFLNDTPQRDHMLNLKKKSKNDFSNDHRDM